MTEGQVFPAPAGINREPLNHAPHNKGVPRASGDKPVLSFQETRESVCSPRQRG
ncbi:hypothetical protein IRV73_003169 [Salmonella enterica subsp. enterica]|nr:hypothetical protein [Salmonella enterica subsp. enterica]